MDLKEKLFLLKEAKETKNKPIRSFDRQATESAKAFNGFQLYRNLGAQRTYEAVAKELHCTGANVRKWACRWNWYSRAREFDIYEDQQLQVALIAKRRRMMERQADLGVQLQTAAVEGLARLRELMKDVKNKEKVFIGPQDIARLADVGGKMERTATAEPDAAERPVNVVLEFGRTEDVEEEEAIRAAHGEPKS